jgi:hypothetical protein
VPSNKGAPELDGKDFTAVEVFGAKRWLGELALSLMTRAGDETWPPASQPALDPFHTPN